MELELPALRRDELVALKLRKLFEEEGYRLFRMGSFEEYDLYMQNKPFLMGEDIITFTAADGRLMALKPDVTLSIVKNTPSGDVRRLYYHENVFRRSRQSGEYREINQMGLEFIGGEGLASEGGVLRLAVRSLALAGQAALDLSHMDFVEALLALFDDDELKKKARAALNGKSPHAMTWAAQKAGLDEEASSRLSQITALSGPFEETMPKAKELARGIPGTQGALEELESLYAALGTLPEGVQVRLDFSILNDADYYNGLIFRGYLAGAPQPILSGGRYDNLLRRFEKTQGAVGFAIYLDGISRLNGQEAESAEAMPWINVALPKGRLGDKVYKLFQQVGFTAANVLQESRKLIFEDETNKVRYFLVKPTDVDIYVEHGVADIGVVGRDVLLENGSDVLELLDLGFGKCRLAVAGREGFDENMARPLRVATKYPTVARSYYAQKSRSVEIINLHGSIELAPLIGLSDVIVDIVETGSTLIENNLAVLETITASSARLIANRASWRFKENRIRYLTERLGEVQ